MLETISPYYNDNELKLDYIIYKCNEEKIKVQLNFNDVYFICFSNYIVLHCVIFIIIILIRIPIKAHFLFQPDPIDGTKFKPMKLDIHQGVIKIVNDDLFYDFQLNTTESAIVERDREEILAKKFRGFENPYHLIDA